MADLYANNYVTALAYAIDADDTAIVVRAAAPAALQGGDFRIVIGTELLLVTAGESTTTWTVTRGIEGTTAAAHLGGAVVAHVLTAAGLAGAATTDATAPTTQAFGDVAAAGSATAAARRDHLHGMPAAGVAISSLPAADTLAPADEFLVSQGGVSKAATYGQIAAGVSARPRTYALTVKDTPGLVSYWRLGERTGTACADEQGINPGTYVNTPTLGAAGLLVGDANTAVTFTKSSSESVTLASTYGFPTGAGARTLVFLCNEDVAANQAIIFAGTLSAGQLFYIYVTSAGLLSSYSGAAGVDISGVSIKGAAHHVACVYSGTAWTTYIDGVAEAPVNQTLDTVYGGVTPEIAHEGSTFYFDGTLDEIALWNRALTAAEITNLYNASIGQ